MPTPGGERSENVVGREGGRGRSSAAAGRPALVCLRVAVAEGQGQGALHLREDGARARPAQHVRAHGARRVREGHAALGVPRADRAAPPAPAHEAGVRARVVRVEGDAAQRVEPRKAAARHRPRVPLESGVRAVERL
eukprot:CAMPEP_0119423840 /NCGR_PEP_ID=MMETSP1335-20130426/31226_1 /TAXON_ID=259385 /ORGANISM="Chrysoculter rhomboideus, Strain RCC1486" /LENGTH=136 /DNA_ID=CAMNT_0007449341 /DNA_START=60 /DNA_END=468 /DNA_ORIENTATION=+